jgi:hypothetical protein
LLKSSLAGIVYCIARPEDAIAIVYGYGWVVEIGARGARVREYRPVGQCDWDCDRAGTKPK